MVQLLYTTIYLQFTNKLEFEDRDCDGLYSDCTATSESTYHFDINSAMFDTTANNNSSEESVVEGSDLNVNVEAAKKQHPRILKRNKKIKLSAIEMSAGAVPKMITRKQMKVMHPAWGKVAVYLTFSWNMVNLDYS